MGTVVFPRADVKIFLTASPEIRAERRYKEIQEKNPEDLGNRTLESILESIKHRDLKDSTRKISPLRKAEDALAIDTSHLTVEQVIEKILEHANPQKFSL